MVVVYDDYGTAGKRPASFVVALLSPPMMVVMHFVIS
jgi:hypothetical protein